VLIRTVNDRVFGRKVKSRFVDVGCRYHCNVKESEDESLAVLDRFDQHAIWSFGLCI
jgi:hypothetical protein